MNVQFLETAKAELRQAVRHYNRQREGLGREFAAEVRKQLSKSQNSRTPGRQFPITLEGFYFAGSPYGIIYLVEDKTVFIVAVMHLARDPVVWQERLKPIDLP